MGVTCLTMRVVAATLVLFLDLLSVPRGEGSSSCTNPKGYDGESYTEGCLKNTCKASVWRTSMDGSQCCYNREPYQKNTTITTTVTDDGCVKATIECEEDGDKATMILHTENYCVDHSTVEQVAEIKQLLIEHINQKGCDKDSKPNTTADFSTEEFPLMFLGPSSGSNGTSEVLSLPTQSSAMKSATCTVPTYPMTDISGSVGFVHDGYLHICGGSSYISTGGTSSSRGGRQSSCYKLKESAWVATRPMRFVRNNAASVMLQDGSVLVSGGELRDSVDLRSSEVLTASGGWSAAIELPRKGSWHCMLQLATGQLFMNGGEQMWSETVGDTYISTDLRTWVTKASSNKPRANHACSEHAGHIWLGGGHNYDRRHDATTEKYDLKTNTWKNGPDLPNFDGTTGRLITIDGRLIYAGGTGTKNIFQLNTEQDGWIKIGEMSQERNSYFDGFPALIISENICRGLGVKPVPIPLSEHKNG